MMFPIWAGISIKCWNRIPGYDFIPWQGSFHLIAQFWYLHMNFPYKDPSFPERNSLFWEIKDVILFLLGLVRWIFFSPRMSRAWRFPFPMGSVVSHNCSELPRGGWSSRLKPFKILLGIPIPLSHCGGEVMARGWIQRWFLWGAARSFPCPTEPIPAMRFFSIDFSSSSSCRAGIYGQFTLRRRWTLWSMVPLMHQQWLSFSWLDLFPGKLISLFWC